MIAKPETRAFRRSICNACEFKIETLGVERCGKCGCFLSVKTKFNGMCCPINKWGAEEHVENKVNL